MDLNQLQSLMLLEIQQQMQGQAMGLIGNVSNDAARGGFDLLDLPTKLNAGSNFFETFMPYFFELEQALKSDHYTCCDENAEYANVVRMYSDWRKFKLRRCFSPIYEHDTSDPEIDRFVKRQMMKENEKRRRQQMDEEEKIIRKFIDNAERLDPRILREKRFKELEKKTSELIKSRKREEELKSQREEEKLKYAQAKAEAEAQAKAEIRAKRNAVHEKNLKKAEKKETQKMRSALRQIRDDSKDAPNSFDIDQLIQKLDVLAIKTLLNELKGKSPSESGKILRDAVEEAKEEEEDAKEKAELKEKEEADARHIAAENEAWEKIQKKEMHKTIKSLQAIRETAGKGAPSETDLERVMQSYTLSEATELLEKVSAKSAIVSGAILKAVVVNESIITDDGVVAPKTPL